MANTFITMQMIAREALPILVDNLVFPNLIHMDYSADYVNMGDTIQVKRPPVFTAVDYNATTGISVQDIVEGRELVTLDKLADVSMEITARELATDVADFRMRVIEPAAVAIAEKINRDGLDLYEDIPYYTGTAGTTPSGLNDFAQAAKSLDDRKALQMGRRAVWDTAATAQYRQLDTFVKVNESGSPMALRQGEIGMVYNIENYMSQAVRTHTAGAATAATSPLVNGVTAVGATTISIDATAMTGKLLKGDLMTIGTQQFVVTADTADAATNAIANVGIYPAVATAIADDAPITFPDATARAHVANLAFNRQAFTFVTRALPMPRGVDDAYTVSYNGITLRVVYDYDIQFKKNILSMDVLYGFKTVYPELAHRILG